MIFIDMKTKYHGIEFDIDIQCHVVIKILKIMKQNNKEG